MMTLWLTNVVQRNYHDDETSKIVEWCLNCDDGAGKIVERCEYYDDVAGQLKVRSQYHDGEADKIVVCSDQSRWTSGQSDTGLL